MGAAHGGTERTRNCATHRRVSAEHDVHRRLLMRWSVGALALVVLSTPAQAVAADGATPAASPAPAPALALAQNAVFLEALGNGGLWSIDYERFLDDRAFGVRAGFSTLSMPVAQPAVGSAGSTTLTTVPVVASAYLGEPGSSHRVQVGLGTTFASLGSGLSGLHGYISGTGFNLTGTAVIGYRYVPRSGGIELGLAFTPLLGSGGFLPWAGANVGAAF
jgi:hypothetical protein